MKKSQPMLDAEFVLWCYEEVKERLKPIPRGVKPDGLPLIGQGSPFYWYLDKKAVDDGIALHFVYELMEEKLSERPHLYWSHFKMGNWAPGKKMMREIRGHYG